MLFDKVGDRGRNDVVDGLQFNFITVIHHTIKFMNECNEGSIKTFHGIAKMSLGLDMLSKIRFMRIFRSICIQSCILKNTFIQTEEIFIITIFKHDRSTISVI